MLTCRSSQLCFERWFTVSGDIQNLIERDLQHFWHPCSQMKDYEVFLPLVVTGAEGAYIHLNNGKKLIDAISSWWCKVLGHQHPRLKAAISQQMDRFEHVILANTTNDTIVALSEQLSQLLPQLNKVMYAGDGSSAVEIALKMSVHARQIVGDKKRRQFIALENAYHGETVGALSVSDVGLYRDPYRSMLFDTHFISAIPYVQDIEDPLWDNAELHWQQIEKQLLPLVETTTAVIIEPILQGAAGMKIYSQDFLKRLRAFTQAHDIHLIADEIMTGFGRTGKMLACQHANIVPDFLCLSKALTGGWMPFSAMITSTAIYDLFYDDYHQGKSFLHSHTYSGNALGASLALEVLKIFSEDHFCERASLIGKQLYVNLKAIAEKTGCLTSVRSIGAMAAADLVVKDHPRAGFAVYQKAVELGALLRPMGNTIYWLPPLTTSMQTLLELKEITQQAIQAVVC